MKKEIRDRWVTALRSGEYEQGIARFERGGRFCCLGVLCDVIGEPPNSPSGSGQWSLVRDLLDGIDPHDLAYLNDNERLGFPEIAEWIDAHVPVEES
jgi:hypothetical protein